MYSGITQGLFDVVYVEKKTGLINYQVELNAALIDRLTIGASVAIDGVCQTVTAIDEHRVSFQAMGETLARTTLIDLAIGRRVSVERSLRYGDEIGGHEMAGHVMGTAEIATVLPEENNLTLWIRCPQTWMKYILAKGFIGVDGSSLTVGTLRAPDQFSLHLIPETLRLTNFAHKQVGDRVNIELDARTVAIVDTVEQVMRERALHQHV